MACKIEIEQNLRDEITEKAKGIESSQWKIAQQKAKEINTSYGFDVVKVFEGVNAYINKVIIDIPAKLVDAYHAFFTDLETKEAAAVQAEDAERAGEEFTDDYLFQIGEQPMSTASPETIALVKKAAAKMGIDIQKLSDYLKGNPVVGAKGVNALADVMHKIVAIAEGKENVALTEEMVHVATAMLEMSNPKMVTEMIAKIDRFAIYQRTLNEYKNNPKYQLSNGKPDIRKIKKEAVDKLIAELIVRQSEGSTEFPELLQEVNRSWIRNLWNSILDAIRSMYRKSDISIFEQTAAKVMEGNITGEVKEEGIFFQLLSKPQEEFQQKLAATNDNLVKVYSKEVADPMFMDTEEANNWYEIKETGRRVKNRVTDRVKAWYDLKFFGKVFTEQAKILNELKRQLGVKFHGFMEEIHGRYFNSDGTRKTAVGPRPVINDPIDRAAYQQLENYFTDLVASFSKDGKTPLVFSEIMLYDAKADEAGTLDLVIVEESGKAHIFDWKFMQIHEKSEDVPWFKKGAFNIQLGRYKEMLLKNYGIKEIGMNRAIPIIMEFKKKVFKTTNANLVLKGLKVGSVDVRQITDLKLLPVSEQTESTATAMEDEKGAKKLDEFLVKLNGIFLQIGKTKATIEDEKEFKSARLNLLERAMRVAHTQLDITPLIEVIREIRKEGEMIINDYKTIYEGKPVDSDEFIDKQLSDFSDQIREYIAVTSVLSNITPFIGSLIYDKNDPPSDPEDAAEARNMLYDIIDEQEEIKKSEKAIQELSGEFADKFIGHRNLETDLLSPSAVVKGFDSWFGGVSDIALTSVRILFKLVTNAKGKASRQSLVEVTELMEIRKRLAARGGDLRKLVQQIYQKSSNKLVNKLIYRYDKAFFDGLRDNALIGKRDMKWITDNIDVEAYKIEAGAEMAKHIAHISAKYKDSPTLRDKMIIEEQQRWDITKADFNGFSNYILPHHPLQKWQSAEYTDLLKDQDLLDLYNYILKINEKAKDVGYIENKGHSTFIPFVRKSMAESLTWDFDLSAIKNWGSSLSIDASTVGYGSVNEINNELEHAIPKYFTHDFTKGGKETGDVSEDLFRNMIMYTNHVNKYTYLSAVEGQLKLVKTIEQFKDHYKTNSVGRLEFDVNNQPIIEGGNEENTKMFDDFFRGVLYEEKYPLSDSDTAISTGVGNFIKKAINKVVGSEMYKIDETPSAVSLVKTIDMINRGFQLKTLGFEFVSGSVNIFGGNIQIATQAGNYFKGREVFANEMKLIGNRFINDDEREMFIQLIDKFMPMKDDPTYNQLQAAGMNTLTRANFSDALMMFMRMPEQHLEKSVFLTLLENTMIEDGKIISIREFVRDKYANRWDTPEQYHQDTPSIEKEVAELKATRSIESTKKLVDGKLVIPGLDLNNSNKLQRLTKLTRMISRNATGGTADSDRNRASMNIWFNSMMVFKMWIPKLLATRFDRFKKVSDDFSTTLTEEGELLGEKFDIGRIRLWMYVLTTSLRDKSTNVMNILSVNAKGIALLDEMYLTYAEEYRQTSGKEFKMTKANFNDLILNNLRNQVKELTILASLFGAVLAMGFIKPPDDADKATKNFYRFSGKVVDKFVTELSFFYNPIEFEKLLSGGIFPAVGLFTDITRFTKHFMMQTTGLDISNPDLTYDEVLKKAQPIKNFAKILPVTKSMLTYGAIFSSDFAKEFDITIQKQAMR